MSLEENLKEINTEAIEVLNALNEELEKAKATFREKAQVKFKEACKELFELVPYVKTVAWTQYTPYFNDGDPCYFRVNGVYFSNATKDQLLNAGHPEEVAYDDAGNESKTIWSDTACSPEYYSESRYRDKYKAAISAKENEVLYKFSKFIDEAEELMEITFGDGVYVVLTKDGAYVEEYSHD